MGDNVISLLLEIKLVLYILIGILTLSVVANFVRAWAAIKSVLQKEEGNIFNSLFEEGKLDELLGYCEEKLKHKRNHSYALWYKAKVLYQQKDYANSKVCFEKLFIVVPCWNDSHIIPYLEKIRLIENESN